MRRYGKELTARAQFGIGRAREKQGANEAALAAYQAVVEKFPNDPLAADAQYQIGYIWAKATRSGSYDPAAANNARTGFEDFSFRHPNSEKAAQARQNLKLIEHKQTSSVLSRSRSFTTSKNLIARRPFIITKSFASNPARWKASAPKKRT